MRLLLIILGALAAIVCIEKPAEARDYPWCAYYNFGDGGGGGAENCGWATIEQCMATVRGIGGSCGPNPMSQPPPGPHPLTRQPRRY
jgi:Protein of unknown function (DUF3551)